MNDLFSLPVLNPEIHKIQAVSGLRLADMVEKNPNQPLILLDVTPRYQAGQYPKGGYIFSFMGKQFLIKLGDIVANLAVNQSFKTEIRKALINGEEIKYVVATL